MQRIKKPLGVWRCRNSACSHDRYGILWHGSRLWCVPIWLGRTVRRVFGYPLSRGIDPSRSRRARVKWLCPRCRGSVIQSVALWDDFHTGYTDTKSAMMDPVRQPWQYRRHEWPLERRDLPFEVEEAVEDLPWSDILDLPHVARVYETKEPL